MATLRPLGVGSQILTHGDKMAGFYGEVNGIISADDLRAMVGVTQGTPMQTGDIAWLKFSHNYKTLYIAKQPIQHSISWDYLHEKDLAFGKMVEIGGNAYLLRLAQGANSSPAGANGGYNSEWDNLVVPIYINKAWNIYGRDDLYIYGSTICQEVGTGNLTYRVFRGNSGGTIDSFIQDVSNKVLTTYHWRPVLELLY